MNGSGAGPAASTPSTMKEHYVTEQTQPETGLDPTATSQTEPGSATTLENTESTP